MANVRRIFPGGNTSEGFYSFHDNIIGPNRNMLYILKGMPGGGKSSMMKEIGKRAYEKGYTVELHNCPSDPNSIDAIVIEELKIGIIDGTPPQGIVLDANTGIMSGQPMPGTEGEYNIKVVATTGDIGSDFVYKKFIVKGSNKLTGNLSVRGNTTYGSTLFATFSNTNNTGTLTYEWRHGHNEILATGQKYTLKEEDIDRHIYCFVTSDHERDNVYKDAGNRIDKARGPAAPQGLSTEKPTIAGGEDGKIIGTTSLMEYLVDPNADNGENCEDVETSGLKAGTYYVRLKSTNTVNEGDTKKVIVLDTTTVPTEPTGLEVINGEALGSLKLKWIVQRNSGGLPVLRYEVSKGDDVWEESNGYGIHDFSGLDLGSEYTFKIRGVNDLGGGEPAEVTWSVPSESSAKLQVIKSADKETFLQLGENIKYIFTVSNVGNVMIKEPFTIVDENAGELNKKVVVSALRPGDTFSIIVYYKVTQADIDAKSITGKVTVTGDGQDYGQVVCEDTLKLSLFGEEPTDPPTLNRPSLEIRKSADKEIFRELGEKIVYTYEVSNKGDVRIEGSSSPVMGDKFLLEDDKIGKIDTSTKENYLDPGESFIVTAEYTINEDDIARGYVTNTGKISGGFLEGNDYRIIGDTDKATVYYLKVRPNLEIKKSADKEVFKELGEKITYTYKVTNTVTEAVYGPFALIDDKIDIIDMTSSPIKLEAEETFTVSAEYIINQGDMDAGQITNIARVRGVFQNTEIFGEDQLTIPRKFIDPVTPKDPVEPSNPSRRDEGGKVVETVIIKDKLPQTVPKLNKEIHFQYMQGYEDNTIRPEAFITRGEVAAVFFRLLADDYRKTIKTEKNVFTDVKADLWSATHISTLSKGGIIKGYTDKSFKPAEFITRGELAAIASRFDKLSAFEKDSFSDISGHWANGYINSAVKKGWIKGYADGTFKPNQNITRAEFVSLVNNLLGRKVKKDNISKEAKQFPDLLVGKWYYEAMQEAINSHHYTREKDEDYEVWTDIYYPVLEM